MNGGKMDARKGDILSNITIESMAAEGKCVARYNGMVVFIDGGVPGDVADLEIIKIKSHFLEARIKSIVLSSENRLAPFCNHFGACGGCRWQHMDYQTQLKQKQNQVADA